jgi:salicylate hydroxylase
MISASTSASHAASLQIIIIGAGIGGLTLANLLRQAAPSIHVQIFERDSAANIHAQGGTLGLKDPGGLTALQRLGMYEEIHAVSKTVTQFTILTQSGKHLLTLHGHPHSLRVSRATLRDLLLRVIHQLITFDTLCTGYAEKQGKPLVKLSGGREQTADVVVACDGVKSAIRQQLVGDKPHYEGLSAISGGIATAEVHPLLAEGPLLVIGKGVSLVLDQESEHIGWALTLHTNHKELEPLPKSILKERVTEATRQWYSPIHEIVSNTKVDDVAYLGGFYDKEPLRYARAGNLVLLGDAAHPMSPFRGEGANMAMRDAISFVDTLHATGESQLEQALVRYEHEMLARTRKSVLESRKAAREMHSRNPLTHSLLLGKLRLANRLLPLFQKE